MQRFWRRLGILPYLILAAGFAVLGVMAIDYLTTNIWLIDVERLDLVRAVAQDRADAPLLLDAAYPEVIFVFLLAVLLLFLGISLPFLYILNRRFLGVNVSFFAVIRQGSWIGLWVAFCVWLQMNRTLGIAVALLVAVVFVLLELMMQVRSRRIEPPINFPVPPSNASPNPNPNPSE